MRALGVAGFGVLGTAKLGVVSALLGALAAGCGKDSHSTPNGAAAHGGQAGTAAGSVGNGARSGRGGGTQVGAGGHWSGGNAGADNAGAEEDNGGEAGAPTTTGGGGTHGGGSHRGGVGGRSLPGGGASNTGGVGGLPGVAGASTAAGGSGLGGGGGAGEGGEAGTDESGAPAGGRAGTGGDGPGTTAGGMASGGAGTASSAGMSNGGASAGAGSSNGSSGYPGTGIDPCTAPSGETCDGVDNDCNGAVDDLGEFTCGLGACQRTVTACTGGVLAACIPGSPSTDVDDCNGIDDDCDGAVDEDCAACIHVALDGDDVLAASNAAATPFQSVQAALDFAASHREIAPRVCVAAGPTCGAEATYSGPAGSDLTMHDGVDLLANYESTHWTRCTDSTTHLAPATARGVLFSSDIVVGSTLDGFDIQAAYDASHMAGVTVDGAQGVMLANITLIDTGRPAAGGNWPGGTVYAIDIIHGASASVTRSRITGTTVVGDGAAVRASDSRVFIEDNCSGTLDPITGHCTGACGASGAELGDGLADTGTNYVLLLENSPGSRVERNTICAAGGLARANIALEVRGDARAVQIRANVVAGTGSNSNAQQAEGIQLEDCDDAAPWIVDNEAIVPGGARMIAIHATGACHPIIEANHSIGTVNPAGAFFSNTAIACDAGSVPSRCVIADNPSIVGDSERMAGGYGENVANGIQCWAGSCARISNNRIWALDSSATCVGGACRRDGYGLKVDGGQPVVNDNDISAGSASGLTGAARFYRSGVQATGTATFFRNRIGDGFIGTAADFRANTVAGSGCTLTTTPPHVPSYSCFGMAWSGGGKLVDNCIDAYACNCGDYTAAPSAWAAFYENGPDADPLVFENNQLDFPGSPLYLDEGATPLTTADQVNVLTDMTVSGTLSGSCTAPPNAQ